MRTPYEGVTVGGRGMVYVQQKSGLFGERVREVNERVWSESPRQSPKLSSKWDQKGEMGKNSCFEKLILKSKGVLLMWVKKDRTTM